MNKLIVLIGMSVVLIATMFWILNSERISLWTDEESENVASAATEEQVLIAIDKVIHAENTSVFNSALKDYQSLALSLQKNIAQKCINEYSSYYTVPKNNPPLVEDEWGNYYELARARLIMVLVGRSGYSELIAPYVCHGCPEFVWFAYAESIGIRAYYIVEEGYLDQIIDRYQLRDILVKNGYIKEGQGYTEERQTGDILDHKCLHAPTLIRQTHNEEMGTTDSHLCIQSDERAAAI